MYDYSFHTSKRFSLVEFNTGQKCEITYVQWKRETNSIGVDIDKRRDLASRSHLRLFIVEHVFRYLSWHLPWQ